MKCIISINISSLNDVTLLMEAIYLILPSSGKVKMEKHMVIVIILNTHPRCLLK